METWATMRGMGGQSFSTKLLTTGYFWPRTHAEAIGFVLKCDKC